MASVIQVFRETLPGRFLRSRSISSHRCGLSRRLCLDRSFETEATINVYYGAKLAPNQQFRSRLLAPREAARLMGLPPNYVLPANPNEAYHLAGDGVVVPVVSHLAASLLEPLIQAARPKSRSK
jgi:site-specific DNA-cytosine methylase